MSNTGSHRQSVRSTESVGFSLVRLFSPISFVFSHHDEDSVIEIESKSTVVDAMRDEAIF